VHDSRIAGPGQTSAALMLFALATGACKESSPQVVSSESAPSFVEFGDSGVFALVAPFGSTVTAAVAPPPISGGTLLVLNDGVTAVASDPDRDAVYVINTTTARVTFTIALQAGDEPDRVVEDGAARVHVALRGGGALETIDPTAGTILQRRSVCPAPRGAAWDPTSDAVWVACATGELVELPSAGGAALSSFTVERDLRDVLVESDGSLVLTLFRSAEVLRVARDGNVTRRDSLVSPEPAFATHVVWRCIQGPNQAIVAVHQLESEQSIATMVPNAYGAHATVGSVLSVMGPDGATTASFLLNGILPVDVALSPDGNHVAVAAPGSAFLGDLRSPIIILGLDGEGTGGSPLFDLAFATDATFIESNPVTEGGDGASAEPAGLRTRVAGGLSGVTDRQAIAVAFDATGDLLVQTREPAQLFVVPMLSGRPAVPIALSAASRDDTGHDLFHTGAGAGIACASCHPEGGDDGFVWTLNGNARRTPSLRGTIQGTAPYHWPGDEATFPILTNDVYTSRMAGAPLDDGQMSALQNWVEGIPAPAAPSWIDPSAAQRGQAIFERSDTGCTNCHSGAKFTNNLTVDIGTGGAFQVPPLLGVSWRFPFLHNGCAATLADRFTFDAGCDTAAHGTTSQLSPQNLSDLIAYLESI
jgi:cytochrome c553